MYTIRSTTLIIVLLFTITFIQGKPMYPSSSNNIKDYIKHLLNINGSENEYARFLSYLKIDPPKDNIKLKLLYEELFSLDSYISDLTEVYAKYYTLDEIIQLIKFYSNPLGEKTIRFNHILNQQMEDLMLTKISDYIFTAEEHGLQISLPQFK
jgi:hypothetical protein